MARPPLGAAARNIQVGVKITAYERDDLVLEYGSVGRGLRALIDDRQMLRTKARGAIAAVFEVPVEVLGGTIDDAVPDVETPAPTKPHRHKRDHIVATTWDAGMKIETWACACGEELG